jgi:hypothetical protein
MSLSLQDLSPIRLGGDTGFPDVEHDLRELVILDKDQVYAVVAPSME